MIIEKYLNGRELTIKLIGKLDTNTYKQLEGDLNESMEGIDALIFDFEELEYLSSAGLRVLLAAQKLMNNQGSMIIKNVNEIIMEIFEVTGFTDIFTIE